MSTRSCIARATGQEGEFQGRYHHWDGMPTSLGKTLWDTLRGHFQGDLPAMLHTLIDEHPAGWSTIVGKDFQLKPGYTNVGTRPDGMSIEAFGNQPLQRRPHCFCHGQRHESPQSFTHEDLKENKAGLEWLYVFDEKENRLCVRDLNPGEEMLVELNGPEPSWTEIECGPDLARCGHMVWVHFPELKGSTLSTQTYLGKREFEMRDAIAFLIDGKRYANTGSGGNSDFLRRFSPSILPSNCWVASVKAGEGDAYVPYPGVSWVYPPTKDNPLETVVSSSGVLR